MVGRQCDGRVDGERTSDAGIVFQAAWCVALLIASAS